MGFFGDSKFGKFIRLVGAVRNWPRTLIDHLRITDCQYECELRNGCRFHMRGGSDDRHAIFEVFVEGIYPFPVSSGDIVVDVGAHIGCFTVWVARQGANVFSFEPFPDNFDALVRNIDLNGIPNKRVFNEAVSGQREIRQLVLPDNNEYTGRYSLHPGRGSRRLDVRCVSLDDVVGDNNLSHIDLLKIDCQGSEYEILYGTSPAVLARIRKIMVECEVFQTPPEWSVLALKRYLEKHGFTTAAHGNLLYAHQAGDQPSLDS